MAVSLGIEDVGSVMSNIIRENDDDDILLATVSEALMLYTLDST